MYNLILSNKNKTFSEIVTDFKIDSFKTEYEKNANRSLSLTFYKTYKNSDIYNMIQNENILTWLNQDYIIKTTNPKSDNVSLINDVTATHIMYEFQGHYVPKKEEEEESTDSAIKMYLKDYLEYIFKGNKQGFTYSIKGDFPNKQTIESLGDKNGIESLNDGAEIFNFIYYANNKHITIYDDKNFYMDNGIDIIGGYNTSESDIKIDTQSQKTYIKGYGKKRATKEYKNYNPTKTPELHLNGKFEKTGTWYTETINSYYSKTINFKWGKEALTWSFKKGSLGGLVKIYLDDEEIGIYNQHNKTTTTETIEIAKNISKGNYTIKVVFQGKSPNVDYGKNKPRMYVGTEKTTIFNATADLKGDSLYYTVAEYKSPYYDNSVPKQAPTVYYNNITNKDDLLVKLKKELDDEPSVEFSTVFTGSEDITERDEVYFKHAGLGFDTYLKVVSITSSHPLLGLPKEVTFSNKKNDMVSLQRKITKKINSVNNFQSSREFVMPRIASDSFGSVLINE